MRNPEKTTKETRWVVLPAIFLEIGVFYALENSGLYQPRGLAEGRIVE